MFKLFRNARDACHRLGAATGEEHVHGLDLSRASSRIESNAVDNAIRAAAVPADAGGNPSFWTARVPDAATSSAEVDVERGP